MKPLSLAKHGFMAFWYSYVGTLNSIWPSITLQGKRLVIFPNVYKPLENEYACSEYCREGDRVLDLGCGSGVGTVFCAPKAREVVAVDISLAALRNTEENCRIHGLKNVKVMKSDMFSGVEGKFDLILANSPYLEDEFEAEEQQFATSVKYMPTLFAQVGDYLAEGGRLLIQFPLRSRPRIRKTCRRPRPGIDYHASFASEAANPLSVERCLYAGRVQIDLVSVAAAVSPIACR